MRPFTYYYKWNNRTRKISDEEKSKSLAAITESSGKTMLRRSMARMTEDGLGAVRGEPAFKAAEPSTGAPVTAPGNGIRPPVRCVPVRHAPVRYV